MKQIKSHVFNGKRYNIQWKKPYNALGLCHPPTNSPIDRNIIIAPKQNPKDISATLLHEGLHACAFYLDEETVDRISIDLNDLLWKCGFTLPTLPKKTSTSQKMRKSLRRSKKK